jgi:hypothetical protein
MALPNFLIIGAQKSGTTWLARRLGQHPDVWIAPAEIHFFDKDFNFVKGIGWYEAQFTGVGDETAVGEKTPDYLWANGTGVEGHLPDVHRNIHQAMPNAKLIVSLRNPVERAISAVNHIIRSGRISSPPVIDELLVGDQQHLIQGHGVIDYGRYHRQLQAYLQHFDPGQMLVLIFEEDIVENPTEGLTKACSFLGVDESFEFSALAERSNAYQHSKLRLTVDHCLPFLSTFTPFLDRFLPMHKVRPSEAVMRKLYETYETENDKLFDLLARPIPPSWQYAES